MSLPDHDSFLAELERGREYEKAVALRLLDEGFAVRIGTLEKVTTPWEGKRFREEVDLIVFDRIVIEVKSSRRTFTCRDDHPYAKVFTCTVKRWDERSVKPYAFVFVSQPTGAMLVLGGYTFSTWEVYESHDSRRNGWATPTYCAPREMLLPFSALVNSLRRAERT